MTAGFEGENMQQVVPASSRQSQSSARTSIDSNPYRRSIDSWTAPVIDFIDFLSTYKFSDPRWLIFPAMCAFLFSGLALLIAYCQLLDPAPIDPELLKSDVEKASRQILNPDTETPCLEVVQSACVGQYLVAAFFCVCAFVLTWLGVLTLLDYSRINKSKGQKFVPPIGQRLSTVDRTQIQPEQGSMQLSDLDPNKLSTTTGPDSPKFSSGGSGASGVNFQSRTMLTLSKSMMKISPSMHHAVSRKYQAFKQSWLYKQTLRFHPGGDRFWYRCFSILQIEIVLQMVICFVVDNSYAKTNASVTSAQVALIILNVNFFMLVFYLKSEVGYVAVNLISELAYLSVRASVSGMLSMRSHGFLDFLTLAVPYAFCIWEIFEITQFILHARQKDKDSQATQTEKKSRRSILSSVICVLVTTFGVIVMAIVLSRGSVDCPKVYSRLEQRPENSLLPVGMNCFQWQYNFFLSPACDCIFMDIENNDVCVGPEEIEPVLPHMENIRFLKIVLAPTDRCTQGADAVGPISKKVQQITITNLNVNMIRESWKELSELKYLVLAASSLTGVDVDMLNSWPKLQHFGCYLCPEFDNADTLLEADLPRLKSLDLFGAVACPTSNSTSKLSKFNCVDQNAANQCETIPDWILQYFIRMHVAAATHGDCVNPHCVDNIDTFLMFDSEGNGLISPNEFKNILVMRSIDVTGFSDAGVLCTKTHNQKTYTGFLQAIRDALPLEQDFFPDSTIYDGLTIPEYIAFNTGYGHCAECSFIQENRDTFLEVFNELNAARTVPECDDIGLSGRFDQESFNAYCLTEETACLNYCTAFVSYPQQDIDEDGYLTEEDMRAVARAAGTEHETPVGFFGCIAATMPGCLDVVNGTRLMRVGRAISIGRMYFSMPPSLCSECEW